PPALLQKRQARILRTQLAEFLRYQVGKGRITRAQGYKHQSAWCLVTWYSPHHYVPPTPVLATTPDEAAMVAEERTWRLLGQLENLKTRRENQLLARDNKRGPNSACWRESDKVQWAQDDDLFLQELEALALEYVRCGEPVLTDEVKARLAPQ